MADYEYTDICHHCEQPIFYNPDFVMIEDFTGVTIDHGWRHQVNERRECATADTTAYPHSAAVIGPPWEDDFADEMIERLPLTNADALTYAMYAINTLKAPDASSDEHLEEVMANADRVLDRLVEMRTFMERMDAVLTELDAPPPEEADSNRHRLRTIINHLVSDHAKGDIYRTIDELNKIHDNIDHDAEGVDHTHPGE